MTSLRGVHAACFTVCVGAVAASGREVFEEGIQGGAGVLQGWAGGDLFFGVAGALAGAGVGDDLVPVGGALDGEDGAGASHLFVRPECPADMFGFEGVNEGGDPVVGVFAGLAEPDGDVVAVAEGDVRGDDFGSGRGPVFVEGVDGVAVEGCAEDVEVGVPLCAAEDDDVVGIDFADGADDAAVEGFEGGVVLLELGEVGDWFVEQVVSDDGGIVGVVGGDAAPDIDGELLVGGGFEEPGVSVAVVDVGAGLSAGGAVHVEDDVHVVFLRPSEQAVG